MKKSYTFFAFLSLLLITVYFSWSYVRTTPQYSLYRAYYAANTRDYQTFTEYVDVDQVVDRYISQKFKNADVAQEPDNVLLQLKTALIDMLRKNIEPAAVSTTKALVKKGVESGTLVALYKPHTVFMMLINAKVTQQDNDARVEMRQKDKQTIILSMQKVQGHWQVYEFRLAAK